jgi:trehalose-6-phosphatase
MIALYQRKGVIEVNQQRLSTKDLEQFRTNSPVLHYTHGHKNYLGVVAGIKIHNTDGFVNYFEIDFVWSVRVYEGQTMHGFTVDGIKRGFDKTYEVKQKNKFTNPTEAVYQDDGIRFSYSGGAVFITNKPEELELAAEFREKCINVSHHY